MSNYDWLKSEKAPRILVAAVADIGVTERPGGADNPVIMRWARDLGVSWYTDDSIPWCGLAVGHWAKEAGHEPPAEFLRALAWAKWGVGQSQAMLGDVLVFTRKGGGHVGLYVGETGAFYHVLGGNQSDAVNVRMLPKGRCVAIRRTPWTVAQPPNVRVIKLSRAGIRSTSEQ